MHSREEYENNSALTATHNLRIAKLAREYIEALNSMGRSWVSARNSGLMSCKAE